MVRTSEVRLRAEQARGRHALALRMSPKWCDVRADVLGRRVVVRVNRDAYPFRGPDTVSVDGCAYRRFLTSSLLKAAFGRCLCCESLLCGAVWSPSKGIDDVLDEVALTLVRLQGARDAIWGRSVARQRLPPGLDAEIPLYLCPR